MQRSALATAALLTAASLFSSACNDLGSCDDPAKGRTTVVFGGQLMFTGQAIINKSCLSCHSSMTSGKGRDGAPAGLNFDLLPLAGTMTVSGAGGGVAGVALDAKALAGLRIRQRRVYDLRELIWEQIDKGLMPPGKSAAGYKDLTGLAKAMFGMDGSCTRGAAHVNLDDSADREAFRNWLACDVPIIEASSNQLPYKAPPAMNSGRLAADIAAGSAVGSDYYSVPGNPGYQYPACGGGGGDAGMGGGIGFDKIYMDVLMSPTYTCLVCHGGGGAMPMGNFDIGTIDKAYTTLLGTGQGGKTSCAMVPVYVKPNDPANSYLLNMVVKSKARCAGTPNVMPLGSEGISAADVDLITQWIMAGAPRTAGGGATGGGGADAGVDAGR